MLNLTRYTGERIVLHRDGQVLARVTVLTAKNDAVKLGFEAEESVRIDREEIYLGKGGAPASGDVPRGSVTA